MGQKYPHLFTPLTVRGVVFKNRVLAAPVPLGGPLTPQRLDGYENLARGGFAAVGVDAGDALGELDGLAGAVRDHGAAACAALRAGPERTAEQWGELAGRYAAQGFQMVRLSLDGDCDPAQVCREVRRACGDAVALAICLRAPQEGEDAAPALELAGAVREDADLICVEGAAPEAVLALAEAARKAASLPVGAQWDFAGPAEAEVALASGKCDFAVLAGGHLADPDFVRKTLLGREDEITPCLGCARCGALEGGLCPVRPQCGQELRWRMAPRPTGKRRVMVAGAGPAGLYAAATAAERGHDVILVEGCRQPGGLLWFTSVDGNKTRLRRFRDSLIARCTRLGVKFQLGTTLTAGYLSQMRPDALICAVGSAPARPGIPGIERAHHVLYGYDKPGQVGQRVVIIGGGLAGCESALWLAGTGRQVLILERGGELARGADTASRQVLLEKLRQTVAWDCAVQTLEITPDGVRYVDGGGEERFAPAGSVLYAVGQLPNERTVEELRGACGWVVPVGGCAGAGSVGQAVRQGFCAAMDIL